MNSYDAIVVGAGPAGSTCAKHLNAAGMQVLLLDKKVFPRVKPCAGWVTPQVIEALDIDIDHYRRENTFQPITGFFTGIIGRRMIETHFPQPVSYGIRRIEFDNYLLRGSGVPCAHHPVKQIVRKNNRWQIDRMYNASLLIGAGGHFCPVARMARKMADSVESSNGASRRRPTPSSIVVYAQEIEFEISSQQVTTRVRPEIPELYFCDDLQGYGWCFRKGDFLNVGLGRASKAHLSSHVREFWNFLQSRNRVSGEMPPHFLGHAYRLYADRKPKLYDKGLLLIGDAAGLAYPQSGEGIRPAIESAMIAADVAAAGDGDFRPESLVAYEHRLVERLGPVKSSQVVAWLPTAWLQQMATQLMATKWFAKKVVVENWFLHRRQGTLKI